MEIEFSVCPCLTLKSKSRNKKKTLTSVWTGNADKIKSEAFSPLNIIAIREWYAVLKLSWFIELDPNIRRYSIPHILSIALDCMHRFMLHFQSKTSICYGFSIIVCALFIKSMMVWWCSVRFVLALAEYKKLYHRKWLKQFGAHSTQIKAR